MAGANLNPFGTPSPRALAELFYERLAAIGALNRAQMFANTYGQMENEFPWTIPMFRKLGFQVAITLAYTISPRHTDEYYAQKTRDLLPFKPDAIYLEDQCGILTIDRARTLLPAIVRSADGLPVELHAHNTTGLASLVYLEALQLGIRTLHTALPPLADGPSQPSVFNIAHNARLLRLSAGHRREGAGSGRGAAYGNRTTGEAADRRPFGIQLRAIHPSDARRCHLEPAAPAGRTAPPTPIG